MVIADQALHQRIHSTDRTKKSLLFSVAAQNALPEALHVTSW